MQLSKIECVLLSEKMTDWNILRYASPKKSKNEKINLREWIYVGYHKNLIGIISRVYMEDRRYVGMISVESDSYDLLIKSHGYELGRHTETMANPNQIKTMFWRVNHILETMRNQTNMEKEIARVRELIS